MYDILSRCIFMSVENQLHKRKISLLDSDSLIILMINEVKGKRKNIPT